MLAKIKSTFRTAALLLLFAFCARLHGASTAPATMSLDECYRLALRQSENLQVLGERIYQFEQRYRQAIGAILPRVNVIYTNMFQDTSGNSSGDGGVGGTLTRAERPEARITARQPLFSGFREFHAMRAARSDAETETLLLERARKELYRAVAQTFYLIVQLDTDLSNVDRILKLTQDRVKELEVRARLGKSRRSEVLTVESQLASLRAQRDALINSIANAQEMLTFLTGLEAAGLRLSDTLQTLPEPVAIEQALERAGVRSDVRAQSAAVESARSLVKFSRGAFLPTVGVTGNYYLKRVGFQEAIQWDALLTVDMPIFQGGANLAELRESKSLQRVAELNLQRLLREARMEIRRSYLDLRFSVSQAKTLDEAYEKARESYDLQVKEYRYGLVNNLEVLQALNAMQEAKRDRDQAAVASKLNWIELKIATEEIPQ